MNCNVYFFHVQKRFGSLPKNHNIMLYKKTQTQTGSPTAYRLIGIFAVQWTDSEG